MVDYNDPTCGPFQGRLKQFGGLSDDELAQLPPHTLHMCHYGLRKYQN